MKRKIDNLLESSSPRIGEPLALVILVLALLTVNPCCFAQKLKIKSVKSLTHLLSQVERENGKEATFVTMKLQIYLEDIYISQGTTVRINSEALSKAFLCLKIIPNMQHQAEAARVAARRRPAQPSSHPEYGPDL